MKLFIHCGKGKNYCLFPWLFLFSQRQLFTYSFKIFWKVLKISTFAFITIILHSIVMQHEHCSSFLSNLYVNYVWRYFFLKKIVKRLLYIYLTLSQTSPGFYVSVKHCVFWKYWDKDKLLVMSNFSFSHSVFHSILENFLQISSNLKLLSAKFFIMEESKICCFGKG